jgi:hypothetical protein
VCVCVCVCVSVDRPFIERKGDSPGLTLKQFTGALGQSIHRQLLPQKKTPNFGRFLFVIPCFLRGGN